MNIELVKKIATFSNFESLKLETLKLLEVLKLEQISLQIKPNVINWSNSSGWLLNSKKEFEFNVIHPELKGSVFDEYLQSFPFEIYRTRIMVLQPFNSYSIHKDPTPRVHIPVVTDIKTAFLFPHDNYMAHMPADRSIYRTDTTKTHTFVNYSDKPRIHIVSVIK